MSKFQRLYVLTTVIETGLIPLFYQKDADIAIKIVDACLEGGARVIEFTNRGDGAYKVFEKLVAYYEHDSKLILGCGSIIDVATAALFIQIGANFVVGPTLNEDIAYLCNQRKIAYIPGCGSVNEISQAERLGVEICKYYPGSTGGPQFIRNLMGPMPWTRLMPTGGVALDEKNITDWFTAGATAVGIGSNLITKEAVEQHDYLTVTNNVKRVLGWIKSAQKTK
jgi:2-dehydro-3-deoxyphosphogluconate aldolase / (4S)-4-hydroxy-2-oxoglutarate aldolase